jgi:L-ascorbate metabolism protein UlaG (beta-lactamase superfamily)
MKITFISHAALLIETGGITILTDPWWEGPSFAEQWWNYPRPAAAALEGRKVDYIYISHGHNDHLHPATLAKLSRDATVLVSSECFLAELPRELGFTVREIKPDEEVALQGGVRVRIMPTHSSDTLLAVADGKEVCVDLNDALHSAPPHVQDHFIAKLKLLYPQIDYLFCGYGVASHFPNCYRIPGKDLAATAAARQGYFTGEWVRIVSELNPRFAFPFAGDVVFLEEDLLWVNEPSHNAVRPPEVLKQRNPGFAGQAIDPGPGFQIADRRIVNDIRRPPVSAAILRKDMSEEIQRANTPQPIDAAAVEEVRQLLEKNIEFCRPYLTTFTSDYRCLVRFRGSNLGVLIVKQGAQFTATTVTDASAEAKRVDLVFTTRLPYLKDSLTIPYADEVIFVGSGGIFEFRARTDVQRMLHREIAAIVRKQETVPVRYVRPTGLVAQAKRLVKRALGKDARDLYDLDNWTVYEEGSEQPGSSPRQARRL